MSDQLQGLKAALADRYAIREELGAGGMATVYLAEDMKHHRKVAVKVLRQELAAALGPERFLREIEISARLRHPHILPLYDSGEAGGFLYYVMPHVAGESLRDRLNREKQLPIEDALRIAAEVADALQYAHDQNVIHRDIKPENILLESGHAVVADFGIARAVAESGGERLTDTGLSLGTPTYMSPEQAAGNAEIDGRSDTFALGIVLYEMLIGEPPFDGPTAQAIVAKILTEPVPPLRQQRGTVSEETEGVVMKALAKVPADRIATAGELSRVLRGLETTRTTTTPVTIAPVHRWKPVAAGVAIVAAAIIGWMTLRPGSPTAAGGDRPSIAVLPFENIGAPENEYFADGITEEMTSRLAQISGLRVIARTSTLRYKGTTQDIREIGAALGVDYILEGTVRTDRGPDGTGQVRVTPQLVIVSDNSHLWTDRFDASLLPGAVFEVQGEIAEQVARALNITLLGSERTALRDTLTVDPEAHDAYLLGRFYWNKRRRDDLVRAEEYFRRAIDLDPTYVQAYVGLSDTYTLFDIYNVETIKVEEAFARAEAAARRAIDLDSTNAGAYASLGMTLTFGAWNWPDAEAAFQQAMALDPEHPQTHYWYAQMLWFVGDLDGAVRRAARGAELEPTSAVVRNIYGIMLSSAGRFDEAVVAGRAAAEFDPEYGRGRGSFIQALLSAGEYDAAMEEMRFAGTPDSIARLTVGAQRGDPAARAWVLQRARAGRRGAADVRRLAELGEPDEALDLLEVLIARRSRAVPQTIRTQQFDRLRSHPRYLEIVRRLGIRP
ncbi:MAG: protein kinase [Gemmatimonadetes bacterium]|nr:protein kinase [Gemmatimonadota bacterium]